MIFEMQGKFKFDFEVLSTEYPMHSLNQAWKESLTLINDCKERPISVFIIKPIKQLFLVYIFSKGDIYRCNLNWDYN